MGITNKSNTFGIHFILRNERERNGKSPIYARIVVNKTRSEIALKQYVSRSDWNESKGTVKSKTNELKKVNNYLEEVRSKLFNYYLQLEKEEEVLSFEVLKNIYLGKGNQNNAVTLCQLFVMHNEQMKTNLSPGTIKNYYTTEKYIKLFLENSYKRFDIFLNKLD